MSKLVLYGVGLSPPVRACRLTLQALGLPYKYTLVEVASGAQKSEEYKRKNPQHTVPTLEDEGRYLWDSHAICAYLVRKYAKDDQLYPKDFYARAVVDQRLHFETGVLFQGCVRNIINELLFKRNTELPQEKVDAIYEAYDFLELFLEGRDFMCGDTLTIADFSCVSSVSSLLGLAPLQAEKHARLEKWLERLKQLPYYEKANGKGAQRLSDLLTQTVTKIV